MLEATHAVDPRLVSTTRSIAAVDPIRAFTSSRLETRALWYRPSAGEALVGLGGARTVTADVAASWRELAARADGHGPVLLGGFTFDPMAEPTALWDGFGAARFVLPERLVTLRQGAATLTTNALADSTSASSTRTRPQALRLGLDPSTWKTLVADSARGIRDGSLGLHKVVLARAHQVPFNTTIEAALRSLTANYPTCTIFAFAQGEACFLGATPERLVGLHDGTATTMALAGSAARGRTSQEDLAIGLRLLADPKERTEHAVVLSAIREALGPLSTRLMAEAQPRLRKLPNLQHLVTPVRAQVRTGCSVLDLVERLHPTPAVGGYPRERALDLIRAREGLDRGWYAAPFGWINPQGEGEFVVGLRSALIRRDTATLFAGCGIVGDSDAETEAAEWGWKLRPMLTALGAGA